MKTRTWLRLTLGLLISAIVGLSLTVITVDPFQIYHLAVSFVPPIDNTTQVYSNAGIVRNYDYDSAIVGTSVTENFRPSYMDKKLGGHYIKLCTAAGTVYNHALLLRLAFKTHAVKRIVYGLDVYSLIGDVTKTGSAVPMYLYNDNPFDDCAYWLNRSVLASFLPRCLSSWGQQQTSEIRDSMYSWAGKDRYGKIALYNASFTKPASLLPSDRYLENAEANLRQNILPYIEDHPETHFDFFFPPYSAAEWATMESKGTLDAVLFLRGLAFDRLCAYENVTVYDFSAREDWVTDLQNYKDTTHYGQWINDAIVDCIAGGENAVTSRYELDTASQQLHDWADAQIEAGGWVF